SSHRPAPSPANGSAARARAASSSASPGCFHDPEECGVLLDPRSFAITELQAAVSGYAIELELAGRLVVVVGGGAVALRRARALVEAGARVTVIAPEGSSQLAALPVTLLRRRYRAGDLVGSWLVPAATDAPAANAAVAAEAEGLRIWCVRADHATATAARIPAVTSHGDITVAVTSGGDPRRSQRLRSA